MDQPAADVLEVSVFGPGFGECIVAHIGDGDWVVIDCCLTKGSSSKPAALNYLESMGVDPASAVRLIIITHWHDDHIRGMEQLVSTCSSARVCMPAAFGKGEFLEFIEAYSTANGVEVTSGVDEISSVIATLVRTNRQPVPATASKLLLQKAGSTACSVWALSPSDAQFLLSLQQLATMIPDVASGTKKRAVDHPNDLSVVCWLTVGDLSVLLGADLEEKQGKADLGWSAVLNSTASPQSHGKAIVFKIPHHGSENGHHDNVWSDMLARNVVSILTPWNKKYGLPKDPDIDRICNLTDQAFTTSRLKAGKFRKSRPHSVERTIRETVGQTTAILPMTGHVRFRQRVGDADPVVELLDGACPLVEITR